MFVTGVFVFQDISHFSGRPEVLLLMGYLVPVILIECRMQE